MEKIYYMLKLNPSRPDFAQTMTDEERGIMQKHVEYWKEYLDKGILLIYGPVLDPKSVYGLGIVKVDSKEQVESLIEKDPASKINQYEFYQMLAVVPS